MNQRQQKGYDLAAHGAVIQDGVYWRVLSQSGGAVTYRVNVADAPPVCTCPDYELSGVKCKHIYAVEYAQQAGPEVTSSPTLAGADTKAKRSRRTYRQDWPAYNAAQTNEKALFQSLLFDLVRDLPDLPQAPGPGRPRLPLREMVFAACFKVYSTVSCRRFMSDLADAQAKGYLCHLPHFNSIFNYLEAPALTSILHALIERSALALKAVEANFAVDSTGFSTCRYVRWYDAKYGQEMERHDWVKAHIMCGVTTNIITSVEITGAYANDTSRFAALVNATARNFHMYEVSADKAYSTKANLTLVERKGATPYIPFKVNATANRYSDDAWDRLYHFFMLRRETFLEHYHRRSVVESTMFMLKAKFGDSLRSKSDIAQVNELLCKVLCHNICCVIQSMYELGIEPDFGRYED